MTRTLLMPDARSFADVLEYVAEWDHETMSHRNGVLPADSPVPEPRYLTRGDGTAARTTTALLGLAGIMPTHGARNEVGPFCSVDLAQIGGKRRGLAVRATDAVMEAVAPHVVTEDDHLSFRLIAHRRDGQPDRVLVILQHGYISGSHWLAYIDPATLPADPFVARDTATAELRRRIEAATAWCPWARHLPGGAMDYGYDGWYPGADEGERLQRRGYFPHTRAVEVAHIAADGTVTYYPEGLAHLTALEADRDARKAAV